ncbi:MAG: molybdopterin/thiamine biosynthesis adenylyltransferase [Gammaproteobacteria bacterium]|jgi:molybdopterin/thiamine biosynthesis adenylyltransferase
MNDQQLLRYSRHIMLDGFDYEGQQQLIDSKVLVIGLGGLGSPVAMYLAAAGVGELWLADFDHVDLSNLQRQIAHGESDIGRPKVVSARDEIERINSDTKVVCISEKLRGYLLTDTIAGVDLVLDCSDNFSTRFEINHACYTNKKPLVSGAAIRSEGQVVVFDSRNELSPCYRCLYNDTLNDNALSCSESGVFSPLVGIIGSVQAMEAIKVLTGFGEALVGRLLVLDAKVMEWRKLTIPKSNSCPVCSG